jgi:hypothetical protein
VWLGVVLELGNFFLKPEQFKKINSRALNQLSVAELF